VPTELVEPLRTVLREERRNRQPRARAFFAPASAFIRRLEQPWAKCLTYVLSDGG
jgi:hypothetical protein